MKTVLRIAGLCFLFAIQIKTNGQTLSQKRILVYFKTGVQKTMPNQNAVTITSTNIAQVLANYGLNASNVSPSFLNFNEADTVNEEIGESSRQMDYAKVFGISLPDTSFKASLIASLQNLQEVLYAETDGEATTDLIPADGRYPQQWNMHNTVVPDADIHAEAAWDIFTGNPNAIIAIVDAGVDVNHSDLAAKINGGDNGYLYRTDFLQSINYDLNYPDYTNHPIFLNPGLDDNNDYDIVFVHWKNGTDYIQRNAYVLEAAIKYVNDNKVAYNGTMQQNVIIGLSMGGLVARYALRDMELNNLNHDTRLFVSHDAPHQGANVPVGYQVMVQNLAPWKIIDAGFQSTFPQFYIRWVDMFPQAIDAVATFNSPAAKQMSI